MTADLRATFAARLQANPNYAGVIPVGDAFQRAVDTGVAQGDGFYTEAGVYATERPQDKINLWWIDYLHASKHGSYLSALVIFGTMTGINPASFGASEQAAIDLDIAPATPSVCSKWRPISYAMPGSRWNEIHCLRSRKKHGCRDRDGRDRDDDDDDDDDD